LLKGACLLAGMFGGFLKRRDSFPLSGIGMTLKLGFIQAFSPTKS